MPDNWTFYVSEIIWEAGVCAYSFDNGNIVGGELKTSASCLECAAKLEFLPRKVFKKFVFIGLKNQLGYSSPQKKKDYKKCEIGNFKRSNKY